MALLFGVVVSLIIRHRAGRIATMTASILGGLMACANAQKHPSVEGIPMQKDGGTKPEPKDASVPPIVTQPSMDAGTSCTIETCDGEDNNCDGETDEGFDVGALCNLGVGACERSGHLYCSPDGTVDCDARPGEETLEIPCNGIDEDCNGSDLQGTDVDQDEYKVEGELCGPIDCDDHNIASHPEAEEIACNTVDENCDGILVQGTDADQDGFMPEGGACGPIDCAPDNARQHPFAEAGPCIGIDYNCSGAIGPIRMFDDKNVSIAELQSHANTPTTAFSGSHFGIVWHSVAPNGDSKVRFRMTDRDGNSISEDITLTENAVLNAIPQIVWTGTEFHATWIEEEQVSLARIDSAGNLMDPPSTVSTIPTSLLRGAAHVWTGNESAIVRHGRNPGHPDDYSTRLFLTRANAEGNRIGEDVLLGVSDLPTRWPNLFSNGVTSILAWDQWDEDHANLQFSAFQTDRPIGPEITIAEGANAYRKTTIAGGEEGHGIAWVEDNARDPWNIKFATVDHNGTVGIQQQIATIQRIVPYAVDLSLTWSGTEYWLAWNDILNEAQRIYFARLGPDGTPQGNPVFFSVPFHFSTSSAKITAIDGALFMAWRDTRAFQVNPRFGTQIYSNRLNCR